jgi:hypothetical protein
VREVRSLVCDACEAFQRLGARLVARRKGREELCRVRRFVRILGGGSGQVAPPRLRSESRIAAGNNRTPPKQEREDGPSSNGRFDVSSSRVRGHVRARPAARLSRARYSLRARVARAVGPARMPMGVQRRVV